MPILYIIWPVCVSENEKSQYQNIIGYTGVCIASLNWEPLSFLIFDFELHSFRSCYFCYNTLTADQKIFISCVSSFMPLPYFLFGW